MPYLSLPTEIRQRILRYTVLGGPRRPYNRYDSRGLLISANRRDNRRILITSRLINYPRPCCGACETSESYCTCVKASFRTKNCTCHGAPIDLFLVCKTFTADAIYIAYSSYRFTLTLSLSQNLWSVQGQLEFLQRLPKEGVRALTKLDLRISYHFVEQFYRDGGGEGTRKEWADVVSFLAGNCTLPALHLSIDSGFYREEAFMDKQAGDDLEWLRMAYRDMVKELKDMRGKLKRFHCYFSWWHEKERPAEKWVMGRVSEGVGKDKEDVVNREGKVEWKRRAEEWVHWDSRWDDEEKGSGDEDETAEVDASIEENLEEELGEEKKDKVEGEEWDDTVEWEDEGSEYWTSDEESDDEDDDEDDDGEEEEGSVNDDEEQDSGGMMEEGEDKDEAHDAEHTTDENSKEWEDDVEDELESK